MNRIGLSYSKTQLHALLNPTPDETTGKLIGLTFGKHEEFPHEFEIKRVYFDSNFGYSPISFSAPISGNISLKEGLYRETIIAGQVKLKPVPASIPSDELEFIDPENFDFSYFDKNSLEILMEISNRIIISGSNFNPGVMAFPFSSGNAPFGNLIAEVDMADLLVVPQDLSVPNTTPNPAIIIGQPCPPRWVGILNGPS